MKLVRTMTDEGWLVASEGPKYSLGLKPFHFSSKPVNRMDARDAAEGPLRELWHSTGCCTFLSILDGYKSLCVIHHDSMTPARLGGQIGERYPLHATAPGKVLLAYRSDEFTSEMAKNEGLARFTAHTICTLPELRKNLEQVRKDGYALDLQEAMEGGICFTVPIFNYENAVVAAAGVTILTLYSTPKKMVEEIGPLVQKAGKRISEALGWTGGGIAQYPA